MGLCQFFRRTRPRYLNLTWGAPTTGDAPTSYTVLARTAPGAAPVAAVPVGAVTSFTTPAPNGTFLLSVSATNTVGTGPESATTSVRFPGTGVAPPASPTGVGVSVAGSTATFSWTAPASGGTPTGYVLEAGTSPGFATPFASLPLAVSPTSFVVPGVPAGTYYVRLVAQNAGGTSAPSNEVTLTVAGAAAPGVPTLSASASGSTVNVSWTAGGGGAPTGYTLSASVTPGGAPIATVPVGGASASFPNVPSGTYYLRLTASNGAGTSPASNQVTVTGRRRAQAFRPGRSRRAPRLGWCSALPVAAWNATSYTCCRADQGVLHKPRAAAQAVVPLALPMSAIVCGGYADSPRRVPGAAS